MVRPNNSSVYHVLDHTYAHLIDRLPPERTIITCHDLMPLQIPDYRRSFGGRLSVELFSRSIKKIRRAGQIIADSGSTKASLMGLLDLKEEKITVVPLGIDPVFLKCGKTAKRERDRRTDCILQVGATTEPYKNTDNLLKAFSILHRRRGGQLKLIKAGKPYTRQQQLFIENQGLASSVNYLGQVERERLPAVYQNADVLLMPSLHEGFGLPVLESMACGTPVVTSARGSIPEVSGNRVIYTDPLDPDDIAGGVDKILSDASLRNRLVLEGLAWASAFTWDRTAKATLKIYENISHS
jgi:glycosyltransferase involved in cell wall biosynthesis